MTIGTQYSRLFPSTLWVAPGRTPLIGSPSAVDRSLLVPGDYVPWLVDDTAGVRSSLVTSEVLGTIQPTTAGAYSVFPRFILTAAHYQNTRFKCPVFATTATPANVTFDNCDLQGPNPQFTQSVKDQYETARGDDPRCADAGTGVVNFRASHLTFNDCTFDRGVWYDQGLSTMRGTQWDTAIHGGNFTLNRCVVRRFVDGINWAQGPCGPDAYTLVAHSVLVDGFYANHIVAPPGAHWTPQSGPAGAGWGQTHSDGFQINTGHSVEIKYTLIGGHRNDFADRQLVPYIPGGSSGADYSNSALMIQQETNGYGADGVVGDFDMHDNWFGGSQATVQLSLKNGNTLAGTHLRNNKFLVRHPGWGTSASELGSYILVWPTIATDVSGNTLWDGTDDGRDGTGVAVPIDYK